MLLGLKLNKWYIIYNRKILLAVYEGQINFLLGKYKVLDQKVSGYMKVRKTARIRNQHNQVPHLSQDTKWKSNKIVINVINKSQKVSSFPSGDHKAAINRRESMANTRHKSEMKHHAVSEVLMSILLGLV